MLKKLTTASLATLAFLVGSVLIHHTYSQPAEAFSMKNFDAGNIISDAVFYDSGSMSASQIQAFLDNKVRTCDTQGSQPYLSTGMTVKEYWTPRGEPAPYTCLKDYKQKTPEMVGSSGICGYIKGHNSRTAAQIIDDVSKACGISPKVMLVLLQKEQSLVTDNSPLKMQYRSATGFACPDTAPCNPQYNGFFNQVYGAAYQYKLYKANPNNYNYVAGRNNYILYNPDVSCGGSIVYIQNQATAGLYNYTPYQPNKATRDVPVGVTAPCGAYGNKNFYYQFTTWFGSTHDPNYGYSAYRVRGSGSSSATMEVGTTKTVSVRYRNTGTQPWYDTTSASANNARPVVLRALHPLRKKESGFNGAFATPTRATERFSRVFTESGAVKSDSSIVEPGETVELSFDIQAPADLSPGDNYRIAYQPVIPAGGGSARIDIDDFSMYYLTLTPSSKDPTPPVNAQPTIDDTSYIPMTGKDYSGYRLKGKGMSSTPMLAGGTKSASVLIKNTGKKPWYDISSAATHGVRPVVLHALHPSQRKESGFNKMFATTTRATQRIAEVYSEDGVLLDTTMGTRVVNPGEVARFVFTISAPDNLISGGNYRIYYNPVIPAGGGKSRIEITDGDYFYVII